MEEAPECDHAHECILAVERRDDGLVGRSLQEAADKLQDTCAREHQTGNGDGHRHTRSSLPDYAAHQQHSEQRVNEDLVQVQAERVEYVRSQRERVRWVHQAISGFAETHCEHHDQPKDQLRANNAQHE